MDNRRIYWWYNKWNWIWEKIFTNLESTKLERFASLISLELFQPDPLFREDYEIDEKELKDRVKKILLEIKTNYC